MKTTPAGTLEMWGGIECTVNRVGDRYHDQLERNGHARRMDDLDRVARLGIRTLRYAVLWERHRPGPGGQIDWAWADARMARLRELGIRPIVGLTHHGSGPPDAPLTEPAFAEGLAAFARQVAERYPWVDCYTPVNEPLTTARFAGLYGHWHPHGRDNLTFARALLSECRAVVLAMRAVRSVRPDAQLVQTDDLGKTRSTPRLQYQADFENGRRWLTYDLLCGRIGPDNAMWDFIRGSGVAEAEVGWFRDNPCPPDVVGVNYYVTSERFLDDRLDRYPVHLHGGNGRDAYVDVEAVRACPDGVLGLTSLLHEAWDRFGLPLAVTEAHLGCTREEQLRWLAEVWSASNAARGQGVDVRAVTAWALFGSFDWDTLVTRPSGSYEPGAFDVRSDPPRPTALAALVAELAAGREPGHPTLSDVGWWHRPECRFPHAMARTAGESGPAKQGQAVGPVCPPTHSASGTARALLITGARGSLGRAFARVCAVRGLTVRLLARDDLDIADPAAVSAVLGGVRPWAVVNAAGYARVDASERNPDRCYRENATGPGILAEACRARGIRLVTFSSDLVFDGRLGRPYRESDPVGPLSVYGAAKAEAERRVLDLHPEALVVRSSAFYGPWDEYNFVSHALRTLRGGNIFPAAEDVTVTPTYVPDLVNATLDLLIDGATGVWHLAHPDPVTWADLARAAARQAGLEPERVEGRPARALGWRAARPNFSALDSERGGLLPPLEHGLACYVRECEPAFGAA